MSAAVMGMYQNKIEVISKEVKFKTGRTRRIVYNI